MAAPSSIAATSAPQKSSNLAPGQLSSSPGVPTTLESYFSKSQMSLALTISKSLPEGLSMKEYFSQLQKSIAQDNPQKQELRHVDSCEFWKESFQRIFEENKGLRDKVRLLEERQRISERIPSPELGDDAGRLSRKRPAGLDEVEEWLEDEGADPILPIGDNYLRLSYYILRIGKKRRELEGITKNSDIPEHTDTLSASARDVLILLETALADSVVPHWSLKCNHEPQIVLLFQQMMHQITLGYFSSFEALNQLVRTILGRKKRAEVVNQLVTFVTKALDYLHIASSLQADHENQDRRPPQNKRARVEQSEYAVNKYLSRTLIQVSQMDWKTGQLGHSEILEGILCSVLNHTGRLLSHTVFKEHVAGSDQQAKISMRGTNSATEATKFEFRYIVPILHAALGGTTRKDLVARVLSESRSGRSADQQNRLLLKVKKLMQDTLIKSALGVELEGLKLPKRPEEVKVYSTNVSHCSEQYGPDWFLEAVWAMVGWELVF